MLKKKRKKEKRKNKTDEDNSLKYIWDNEKCYEWTDK